MSKDCAAFYDDGCGCGDDECPDCYPEDDDSLDAFDAQFADMEPEDQPFPRELLPAEDSLPIEAQRINKRNVLWLVDGYTTATLERYRNPVHGAITEIDVLTALQMFTRLYVKHTVVARAEVNPEAAKCNQAAILKMLEELNDEVLQLDLPKHQVN